VEDGRLPPATDENGQSDDRSGQRNAWHIKLATPAGGQPIATTHRAVVIAQDQVHESEQSKRRT
jgi:hypothetical protein